MSENQIRVYALGGLGEVGRNMYCIEQNNEILIVDSGIGFYDDTCGVEVVLPDYSYLKENEHKIIGLFITHGHEDHIGGIPFLLKKVLIPKIYANAFSIKLIQGKLKEHNFDQDFIDNILIEYNDDSLYLFNNFEVTFFRTNHSIPDSFGVIVKTNLGYIIHTGDFKFDLTPISNKFDYFKVASISKDNILLLMSDSTNALSNKQSISEKKVSSTLKSQFASIEGRIIIATFSSNTIRLGQIIEAARSCGRKVAIVGKSLERSLYVAKQLGYLSTSINNFVKPSEINDVNDNEIVIITTGTQGEPLSSLTKMSQGTHKFIKLKNNDTIIFSSSAIPGNQDRINDIVNDLCSYGVNVVTNSSISDVHSSGHAYANELQLMLNLAKPKFFMPIHGEFAMQTKHSSLAQDVGILPENCFILNNGDVLKIDDDGANIEEKISVGKVYIDQSRLPIDEVILKERLEMSVNGFVMLNVFLDKDTVPHLPTIVSRGFLYNKSSHELITKILYKTKDLVEEYIKENQDYNEDELKDNIGASITSYIVELTKRKPLVKLTIIKK